MGRKEDRYNLHHWLCKSRWWATNDMNCEMIKYNTHQAIHTLFANDIFPEQIVRLTNLTSRVLKPEVVKELFDLLNYRDIHNPDEWYKEGSILLHKNRRWRDIDIE